MLQLCCCYHIYKDIRDEMRETNQGMYIHKSSSKNRLISKQLNETQTATRSTYQHITDNMPTIEHQSIYRFTKHLRAIISLFVSCHEKNKQIFDNIRKNNYFLFSAKENLNKHERKVDRQQHQQFNIFFKLVTTQQKIYCKICLPKIKHSKPAKIRLKTTTKSTTKKHHGK